MEKIAGGYVIKARSIQQSNIRKCSPCVREIWDWLLLNANHKVKKYNGFTIDRGQLFRSYSDIRDGLSWFVGYRKMRYSESSTKHAMNALRSMRMIDTMKKPGGVLITLCNYKYFQDSENYEGTNEGTNETTTKGSTYNKNDKNNILSIKSIDSVAVNSATRSSSPKIDYQKIINLFHQYCGQSLPTVTTLNTGRRSTIRTRFNNELPTYEHWDLFFKKAAASDFLMGWHGCSFDWLVRPSNVVKVLENNFSNDR